MAADVKTGNTNPGPVATADFPAAEDRLIGSVLGGRYRVGDCIGEGAMGRVYRGEQLTLKRDVAIKVIQPNLVNSEQITSRFKREVTVAQRLNHPNTVRFYDFGQTPRGQLYVVMEYLKGRTLDEVVASAGALPIKRVKEIAIQVLGSLVEAHAAGVIHRDIKPSNLMLVNQVGVKNFVKLIDFGIARDRSDMEDAGTTRPGTTLGTPRYMSPEQLRGESVGPRSDLYSLAFTLYHLAYGRPPYTGKSLYQVAEQHLSSEEVPLPPLLAESELGPVLSLAMKKAPSERFASARQMVGALTGRPDTSENDRVFESGGELASVMVDPTMDRSAVHTLIQEDQADTHFDGRTLIRSARDQTVAVLPTPREAGLRPSRLWLLVPALLLVAVLAALSLPDSSSQPDEVASPGEPEDTAERDPPVELPGVDEAVARAATHIEAAAVAALPLVVRLVVTSEPSSADVMRGETILCTTPCDTHILGETGAAALSFSLPGHIGEERAVDLSDDVAIAVVMQPEPAPERRTTRDRRSRRDREDDRARQDAETRSLVPTNF